MPDIVWCHPLIWTPPTCTSIKNVARREILSHSLLFVSGGSTRKEDAAWTRRHVSPSVSLCGCDSSCQGCPSCNPSVLNDGEASRVDARMNCYVIVKYNMHPRQGASDCLKGWNGATPIKTPGRLMSHGSLSPKPWSNTLSRVMPRHLWLNSTEVPVCPADPEGGGCSEPKLPVKVSRWALPLFLSACVRRGCSRWGSMMMILSSLWPDVKRHEHLRTCIYLPELCW